MENFKESIITKIIALTLSFMLFFSFCLSDLSSAISHRAEIEKLGQEIFLPADSGKIVDSFTGKKEKQVILIQDFHANPEVQKNIAKILALVTQQMGFSTVALEGNSGDVNPAVLASFPVPDLREAIAGFFMERGMITGPEFFAALSPVPVRLRGVEYDSLYREDYELLRTVSLNRGVIEETLKKIRKFIPEIEQQLSSGFKSYFSKRRKVREMNDYVQFLLDWSQKLEIGLADYPDLYNLILLTQVQKNIDFKKINAEIDRLLKIIQGRFSQEIAAKLSTLRANPVLQSYFLRELEAALARIPGADREYPNLARYIYYSELLAGINAHKLLGEEAQLERAIEHKLSRNGREKDFIVLLRFLDLLEKFLTNRVTAEELDDYWRMKDGTDQKVVLLNEILKPMDYVDFINNFQQLRPYIEKMEKFYRLALERNTAMVSNVKKILQAENKVALVAGGFHTEGIKELLRSADISYRVIAPEVLESEIKETYLR
ncbi:MAG TPA: hypothetical protein VJC03_06075, partial [bacterium]|nr:hypothetical protein [bacterium]